MTNNLVFINVGLTIDIGAPAMMFVIENWPGHLTPAEANSLADRGSRSENPMVVNLASKLALSCLSYADKLNSHDIIQAINQVIIFLFICFFYKFE